MILVPILIAINDSGSFMTLFERLRQRWTVTEYIYLLFVQF